jgi:prepilin-type processing-associated H-X9-DG protein
MSRRRTSRFAGAFTYVELLILVVVIAILTAILLPIVVRMRESKNRQICVGQLRSIGQALLMYQNDNKGAYPRTTYVAGTTVIPTWGTGAGAADPFGPGGPAPYDVTAALFLLIRTQDIAPQVFTCPSTDQVPWDFGGGNNTALNWSNFSDVREQLSYSYQNVYPTDEMLKRDFGLRFHGTVPHNFALLSDMNPGIAGNSRNHQGNGQNVLFVDGHVSFETARFCGPKGDDIFTTKRDQNSVDGGPILGSPFDLYDSVLLPTAR